MRIVIISPFLLREMRGIERWTVELARALATEDPESRIDLIGWRGAHPWPWGEMPSNVIFHRLLLPRYFQDFFAGIAYAVLLCRLKPDVVLLSFTWHGEELALRLSPFFNGKIVLILHYPAAQVPHRYLQLRRSRAARRAAHVIVQTALVAEDAARELGRAAQVIPNGVDASRFAPSADRERSRAALGIPPRAMVLATTAALEKRKGIHLAIASLPALVARHPDLIFLVAGDGPERERLGRQIDDAGLSGHVRLLGAREDVVGVYHAADVFLFLSRGESFGLSLIEAMACGLPVVAAKQRPYDEILPEAGGILVDENDSAAVAAAIDGLLSDPTRRAAMGEENRRNAVERFSWKAAAAGYRAVFLAGRP